MANNYSCYYCGQSFATQAERNTHEAGHTGQKLAGTKAAVTTPTATAYGAQEYQKWAGKPITPEAYGAAVASTGAFDVDEYLMGPGAAAPGQAVTDPNVDWWNTAFGWLPGVYEYGEAEYGEPSEPSEFPLMTELPPQSEWPTGFYPKYRGGTATTPGGYFWEAIPATLETMGEEGVQTIRWETVSEGGWDYMIGYDADGNVTAREPLGRTPDDSMSEYQQETLAAEAEWRAQQIQFDQQKMEQEAAIAQMQMEQQMAIAQMQDIPQWRPGELGLRQQEQAAQQQYYDWQTAEVARQHEAGLAAQPISWLQHAAYTGQEPVVQPWMKPLMPQQYAGLGAGEAIPGYTPEGMTGMPSLLNPSRQYQARMGPTSYGQLQGYQQAQTGARPEETDWRLWSAAPPSGAHTGLSYQR